MPDYKWNRVIGSSGDRVKWERQSEVGIMPINSLVNQPGTEQAECRMLAAAGLHFIR